MRKISSCLVLLGLALLSHAQSDSAFATVRYKLTHVTDTTWPENPVTENYVLYLGKTLNWYTNFDREELIRKTGSPFGTPITVTTAGGNVISSAPPPSPEQVEIYRQVSTVFTAPDGKLTVMETANGKLFAISDDHTINWTILPDTKDIMGLSCQKATGDWRGRTYEAWFTTQLPYSAGPFKLRGLPGLIIEAADTKREVVFSFVSFENLESNRPIGPSAQAAKTTLTAFRQYKEALQRDRQAMIGGSAAGGGIIVAGNLRTSNPGGKPERYRMMNNPIEKPEKSNN